MLDLTCGLCRIIKFSLKIPSDSTTHVKGGDFRENASFELYVGDDVGLEVNKQRFSYFAHLLQLRLSWLPSKGNSWLKEKLP